MEGGRCLGRVAAVLAYPLELLLLLPRGGQLLPGEIVAGRVRKLGGELRVRDVGFRRL